MLERNLRLPKIQEIEIKSPAIIRTTTGTEVHIDAHNNVTIIGQNSLKFKCEGDMEFDADNIKMKAKDQFRIESEKNLIHKAPRIDLNPIEGEEEKESCGNCDKCSCND